MQIEKPKWVRRHLSIAYNISNWSKDPNTQVGSVIVTPTGKPRSWGFNGIPMGVNDHPDRFKRPTKYNFFAHAERNAIDLSESNLEDCILFCTHSPCSSCASSITNNKMGAVYVDGNNGFLRGAFIYRNPTSVECHYAALEMFTEAGIAYVEIDHNNKLYRITKNKGEKPYVRKILD